MPAVKPEIAPVDVLIVATAGVPLLHVPPVMVELNVDVPPIHIVCVPDNVPAVGEAVTVNNNVADASVHPPVPETV